MELAGMSLPESDLSGEKCENGKTRPVAVMLSSDPETRPLSGIGEADLVFEMPVTDGGVTRMMAVFQCHRPKEIGSVRSARSDFIPWVQGLGAVYAHWGGEREALGVLSGGIVDNIDAMKYEGTYYYRRSGLHPPHNGFTSSELLDKASIKLEYSLKRSATVYQHDPPSSASRRTSEGQVMEPPLIYEKKFAVQWKYQPESNTYRRWRGEKEEIDHNTSQTVEASNIVLLKTTWTPISKDYINVKTIGSGEAVIYKNGEAISGTWEKRGATGRLVFYNSNHQEIKFTVGSIWVETLIK
ncbi:MAG: hypothetical protein G01um101444_160 [Parcubacteria group bacterium Gr01-1014_44]|nr:MAG: hypothetical protein G01um101444_160 [Parcubacteria group bacterium Gr01-1014_44]